MPLLLALCLFPPLVAWAEPDDSVWPASEKFDSGAKAFETARRALLEQYVRADLSEDELYRAAVQGMLQGVDPAMRKHNQLLSPTQVADLLAELKGEVVGIGVRFKLDPGSSRAEVIGVVPGSSAASADVREGDLILSVDGAPLKGRTQQEVIAAIRGPAGGKVKLGLLRDTALVERTLTRAKLSVEQVSEAVLPGDVAVLALRGFSETTPAQVRAALERIAKSSARGLIIDLRNNEGGLLEKAVETAKLLLPKGATVAKLAERGGKERVMVADGAPVLTLPVAVLTSNRTGSSAELLAAALRHALKAPLIGERTRGKWSVQRIEELPNRYTMKFTVAHFKDPSGRGWEGEGLSPDIEVPQAQADAEKAERLKPSDRLAADVQLKAAASFLRMR
ncbi:MAG: PDZ domain-containing protein [Archangiaceae bacterium]|nr:PDZ domain-containing protein [Archangiaceae bacterium]